MSVCSLALSGHLDILIFRFFFGCKINMWTALGNYVYIMKHDLHIHCMNYDCEDVEAIYCKNSPSSRY